MSSNTDLQAATFKAVATAAMFHNDQVILDDSKANPVGIMIARTKPSPFKKLVREQPALLEVLNEVGLQLSSVPEVLYGEGATRVTLDIADRPKFIGFLDRARDQLVDDVISTHAVIFMAQAIVDSALDSLRAGEDGSVSEGAAAAKDMAGALSRLGLDKTDTAKVLRQLVAHADQGYDAAFIRAKDSGLLDPPGTPGGPSYAHMDELVPDFRSQWADCVATIEMASANQEAADFTKLLLAQASGHLQYARSHWHGVDSSDAGAISTVFQATAGKLADIASAIGNDSLVQGATTTAVFDVR